VEPVANLYPLWRWRKSFSRRDPATKVFFVGRRVT